MFCNFNTKDVLYDKICTNTQKKGVIVIHHYQRLKDLREDLDLNQTEIAKQLGMKQQQYSEYERGLREIPFYRAVQIQK